MSAEECGSAVFVCLCWFGVESPVSSIIGGLNFQPPQKDHVMVDFLGHLVQCLVTNPNA